MPFTCKTAMQAHARYQGLCRARFFRAHGWYNLVRARARMAEIRAERKRLAEKAAQTDPFYKSTRDDI